MKHLICCCLLLMTFATYGQVFSNKEVGKKNKALADSLKESEYPFALPIWGAKASPDWNSNRQIN